MEGAWVGDSTQKAFKACGYEEIAQKTGVSLVDTKKAGAKEVVVEGMKINISDSLGEEDFLINLPVLKGHCQTTITCALKNMKGLIPDSEKRRFHTMGLMKPIAYLNKAIRQDFILVDGICGDPDFEEGGNPVFRGQVIGARDPVLCDAYACKLLGYQVDDVPYISLAEKLGVGSSALKNASIHKLKEPLAGGKSPTPTGLAKSLSRYVVENQACSACYANVICALKVLKDQGFVKKVFADHQKFSVGQGFQGKKGAFGIGKCTKDFEHHVKGCPPDTQAIVEWAKALFDY